MKNPPRGLSAKTGKKNRKISEQSLRGGNKYLQVFFAAAMILFTGRQKLPVARFFIWLVSYLAEARRTRINSIIGGCSIQLPRALARG
ncbi:MAG: hypothetical protein LBP75_00700 [Planctomycetota bacterium]|nr:hypothetical protein [Planctomycetota bacterium]